jgi:hypothetical protein
LENGKQTAATPGEFLTELGKLLTAQPGVDLGLAEIIAQHLLTATPANDCVMQASAAIAVLAGERAMAPAEAANG